MSATTQATMTRPESVSQALSGNYPYAAAQGISGLSQSEFATLVLSDPRLWTTIPQCPGHHRLRQLSSGLSRVEYANRQGSAPNIQLVPKSSPTPTGEMPSRTAPTVHPPKYPEGEKKRSVTIREPLVEEYTPAVSQPSEKAASSTQEDKKETSEPVQSQSQILDSNVRTPDNVHVLPPPTFSYVLRVVRKFDAKMLTLLLVVIYALLFGLFGLLPITNPWYSHKYAVTPTPDGAIVIFALNVLYYVVTRGTEFFIRLVWKLESYSLHGRWVVSDNPWLLPLKLLNVPAFHWWTMALATPGLWNLLYQSGAVSTEWWWVEDERPYLTKLYLWFGLAELEVIPGVQWFAASSAAFHILAFIKFCLVVSFVIYRTLVHVRRFFIPEEVIIPDFKANIEELSLQHSVDSELLAYVIRASQFTARNRDTVDQLKRAATSWIASNRKTWKEIDITHSVDKAILVAMPYTAFERTVSEVWASDGIWHGLTAASSTSKGNLAGGRALVTA